MYKNTDEDKAFWRRSGAPELNFAFPTKQMQFSTEQPYPMSRVRGPPFLSFPPDCSTGTMSTLRKGTGLPEILKELDKVFDSRGTDKDCFKAAASKSIMEACFEPSPIKPNGIQAIVDTAKDPYSSSVWTNVDESTKDCLTDIFLTKTEESSNNHDEGELLVEDSIGPLDLPTSSSEAWSTDITSAANSCHNWIIQEKVTSSSLFGPISTSGKDDLIEEDHCKDFDKGGDDQFASSSSSVKQVTPRTKKDKSNPHATYKPEQWDERYHELVEYKRVYGDCLVPHNWVVNRPLAQWVKRQRYQYVVKQQLLKQGTIEHPKSMVEDEVEDCWTFGPTGSLDTTNNKSKSKRGGMKRSTLTDERERALEKIGFVWSTHNALWEEKYNELAAFFHKHGHCNVPSKYPSNNKLSVWVRCQRRQYRLLKNNPINNSENKSSMTMERIDRLKAIKFNFNPRNLKM